MSSNTTIKSIIESLQSSYVSKVFLLFLFAISFALEAGATCAVTWSSSATWNGLNWGVGATRYTVNSTVKHGGNEYRLKSIPGFNCSPTDASYGTTYWTNLGSCSTAPTISTTSTSSITSSTASSGGNTINDGGASITSRGVCWNTSTNPTTSNSKTSDGTGTANFASSITGLSPATTYYVRAYATNSMGTSYGSDVSFTTSATAPTLTTTAISSITCSDASSGGNISSDGGASVTARGVCWNTGGSPTTSESKTSNGTGTGAFSSSLTGLSAGTTYYVRAYATNSAGTAYGNQTSFTALSTTSAGSVGSNQSICYNTTPSALTNPVSPSGGSGAYTYQWQSSSDNSSWGDIGGGTSSTYSPGALTANTYYRRQATSSNCGTANSASVLITVYANLSAGAIGSAQTVCYNIAPSTLTNVASPTGGTGAYTYQWQSSSDNSSWGDISGATSSTYSPGALTSNTYYRRVETSGSCGTVYSSSILITVETEITGGTIGF